VRFSSFEFTFNTRKQAEAAVENHVKTDPHVRELIAKMARSEVKSYLQDLAEEAEMPFPSAAGFLSGIAKELKSRQAGYQDGNPFARPPGWVPPSFTTETEFPASAPSCDDECCPGFGGPAYWHIGSGCKPHQHPEHICTPGEQD